MLALHAAATVALTAGSLVSARCTSGPLDIAVGVRASVESDAAILCSLFDPLAAVGATTVTMALASRRAVSRRVATTPHQRRGRHAHADPVAV